MSLTKSAGTIVGIFLVGFLLLIFSTLMFGMYGETSDKNSITAFKTIYFAVGIIVLGAIYLANKNSLNTRVRLEM